MRKQLQSQNLFKIPVPVCGIFVKNENTLSEATLGHHLCSTNHVVIVWERG